jgi:aminoglycoside phosphotransferase (APT) family kinase protein
MPSVREHDLEATHDRLTAWCREVLGLADAELSPLHIPQSGGNVNDTFLFDLSWTADGAPQRERRVCRAEPAGYSNLQSNDVVDQARTLIALAAVPGLPIPTVIAVEEDRRWLGRPFFVMEALPGEPVADIPPYPIAGWLHDAPEEVQRGVYRQAVESLAALHRADPAAVGLGHLDRREAGEHALAAQLRRFREFHLWGSDGVEYEVLERAYEWLVAAMPSDAGPTVINWNDARLGNMLFDQGQLTATLDWELIELGPPEVDLGWFIWHDRFMVECFGAAMAGGPVAPLPGAPDRETACAWYAAASGHEPRDMPWYEMLAAYRMGVYMMRHGKGLIATGQAEPDSGVDVDNVASREIEKMLAEQAAPPRGSVPG